MDSVSSEPAHEWLVNSQQAGLRLDLWLNQTITGYSRTYFQNLIEDGLVLVNGLVQRKRYLVQAHDEIEVEFRCLAQPQLLAQNIPLDILYEDEHILVINKKAGMVVHPGAGCYQGTVANALAFLLQEQKEQFGHESLRPGIVHRLDKDTTGVLITAKTASAHTKLVEAFAQRKVSKTYLAICCKNQPPASIEAPIERDPTCRHKMRAGVGGRQASTLFEVLKSPQIASEGNWPIYLLQVGLMTGRTHQIRVHLKWANCPILGDSVYGWSAWNEHFKIGRQLLHAWKLSLKHPISQQEMHWCAPIPDDMQPFLT